MQQSSHSQMFNGGPPSVPIANITTQEIQKCLEENEQLILAVMEHQRVGKFDECAPHRARLQQNLTFLSNLADALPQPPPPSVPPQILPQLIAQQGQCLQHPEAALMSQQQPASSMVRIHFWPNNDQQQPSCFHQQHFIQAQMGANPIAATDIHMASMQIGVGSRSNTSDVTGNNQVGLGSGNAGNFLGNLFPGYSGGDPGS
ncbi:GRF1-interacting factor 2 [Morus notabilis]|uniref:GRF1-interacting factor 2 n=1 Tax=Morus notabilis TaxID=981085 RepID=UPI000CED3929|nr:GRF1-interacting factor 2 [Morus notabilis]